MDQLPEPARDIIATAVAAGDFTIFVAGIKAAGLTESLAANGPFTVFAPTDAVNYHVVPGQVAAKDLKAGEVMTLHGATLMSLPSSSSGLRINEARVVEADLVASNGSIHAIDAVLLPGNWQLAAA